MSEQRLDKDLLQWLESGLRPGNFELFGSVNALFGGRNELVHTGKSR